MGLFDMVKEKVSELLSGAGDKVTELTGAELPGTEAADQVTQAAENLTDTATGAAEDLTGTATEAVGNVLPDEIDPTK